MGKIALFDESVFASNPKLLSNLNVSIKAFFMPSHLASMDSIKFFIKTIDLKFNIVME